MTKDECEVKLEMGDWMIAKFYASSVHFMYHRCHIDKVSYYAAMFHELAFSPRAGCSNPCWACAGCGASVPEELETVYLLLESEYAYDIMQKHQNTLNNT
jgi:hypothetical protein